MFARERVHGDLRAVHRDELGGGADDRNGDLRNGVRTFLEPSSSDHESGRRETRRRPLTAATVSSTLEPVLGQSKQIDVVLKERGELEWQVVVEVHKGEWLRSRALWLLEEKLNAYAAFVLDGQMKLLYPNSTPASTRIVIASVDPMPDDAIRLLEHAAAMLEPLAVKVSWKAEGGMPIGGVPSPIGFDAVQQNER